MLIGEYSFVGSRVILLPGARVAPRSVVAAGAVVATALDDELATYAGTPARRVGSLIGDELSTFRERPVRLCSGARAAVEVSVPIQLSLFGRVAAADRQPCP